MSASETMSATETTIALLPSAKSNRCSHIDCNKKLLLTDMACKCTKRYCSGHRHPEIHNCTYDFNKEGVQRLSTILLKVSADSLKNRI